MPKMLSQLSCCIFHRLYLNDQQSAVMNNLNTTLSCSRNFKCLETRLVTRKNAADLTKLQTLFCSHALCISDLMNLDAMTNVGELKQLYFLT